MVIDESESPFFSHPKQPDIDGVLNRTIPMPDPEHPVIPYKLMPGRFTREVLTDSRFDPERQAPLKLLNEAITFSGLLSSETVDDPDTLVGEIAKNVRVARGLHDKLESVIMPHLDWGSTSLLNILIDNRNLKKKEVFVFNREKGEGYYDSESDSDLTFRREAKARGLDHAIAHVEEESLLSTFEQLLSDSSPNKTRKLIEFARSTAETTENPSEKLRLGTKSRQLLGVLRIISNSQEVKNISASDRDNLINLALDTATASMEDLPEGDSLEGAVAYQVAATAMHDLAARPGTFEKRVSETDAREFRLRALELSTDWMKQSSTMYENIFGTPIGVIKPTDVKRIRQEINTLNNHLKQVNDAFWLRGIYQSEYDDAVKEASNTRTRKVGAQAIIKALHPDGFNAEDFAPRAAELAVAA